MQTILAIESSSQYCSLAIATPQGVFEHHIGQAQQHSTQLLPQITALLQKANCTQPDVIAVAVGPGAFTSLRVAVGTAQGLALGWGCSVVAVDSLAALAQQACRRLGLQAPSRVIALLDARMGEAYCGAYALTGAGLQSALAAHLVSYDALPPAWQAQPPTQFDCVVGNAGEVMPHWASFARISLPALPLAIDVLTLAQQGLASGSLQATDPALLHPVYVRDQVALTEAQRGITAAPLA